MGRLSACLTGCKGPTGGQVSAGRLCVRPPLASFYPLALSPVSTLHHINHLRRCLACKLHSERQLANVDVAVTEIRLAVSAVSGESCSGGKGVALFDSVPVGPLLICPRPHRSQ